MQRGKRANKRASLNLSFRRRMRNMSGELDPPLEYENSSGDEDEPHDDGSDTLALDSMAVGLLRLWNPCAGKLACASTQVDLVARRVGQLHLKACRRRPLPGGLHNGAAADTNAMVAAHPRVKPIAIHGSIAFDECAANDEHTGNEYVVIDATTPEKAVVALLTDAWKLRRPAVLLSVVGADEASSLRLKPAVERAYAPSSAYPLPHRRCYLRHSLSP
jgi:hypothetical protein